LLLAGKVRVKGQVQTKAGFAVAEDIDLVVESPLPYASRGGFKLAHALDTFQLDATGLVALDAGASTGGFTDVLLQRGAKRVYAVDVGYGQLAWALRQDPRVIPVERTNIRYLENLPSSPNSSAEGELEQPEGEKAACASVDLSFISLRLVLPAIQRLLTSDAWVVALVKPQFEAGVKQVGKGGVVREPAVHRQVLGEVMEAATFLGLIPWGLTRSPITGPAGNQEFLLWLQNGRLQPTSPLGTELLIVKALQGK
jgi:23S rRNA (cytidine1920-2'-O)/16S rRNA (cytidine1409-2'-O)-methyltransferase